MPGAYLVDILQNLIPLQDPAPLMTKIVEAAREVSAADRCLLLHWDDSNSAWRVLAACPNPGGDSLPFPRDLPREVLRKKTGTAWSRGGPSPFPFGRDSAGIEALLTAPLVFPSSNELYGVLCAERTAPGTAFSEAALQNLTSFGNLASLCLENAILFEKASIDEVTRASTKAFFLSRLEEEYHRALRSGGSFALFMTDVDDFKRINDTHGHLAGDRVLRTFVETIKASIRIYDLVGRYGGDEFMILMPGLDYQHLFPVAQKLSQALAGARHDIPGPVTFSFGGAVFPTHSGSCGMDLLLQADMALYQAKGQGKGRIVILGRETPILSSLPPLKRDGATMRVDPQSLGYLDELARELSQAADALSARAECPKVRELAGLILAQVRTVIAGG